MQKRQFVRAIVLSAVIASCAAVDAAPYSAEGGAGTSSNSSSASGDVPSWNQCFVGCGPIEFCDILHVGTDDNCNGEVDETCSCVSGTSQSCFNGDPLHRNLGDCKDGVQTCSELGTWSECFGGSSDSEGCFDNLPTLACRDVYGLVYGVMDLNEAVQFVGGQKASSKFSINCSDQYDCPSLLGHSLASSVQGVFPIKYDVIDDSGINHECSFNAHFVRNDLTIELSWDASGGTDLDLHLQAPGHSSQWTIYGRNYDCGYANCTPQPLVVMPNALQWFSDDASPPMPMNWWGDSCYAESSVWSSHDLGCHSPRLNADNVGCLGIDVTSPNDPSGKFCGNEVIKVDFMPFNKAMRLAVHLFSSKQSGEDEAFVAITCAGTKQLVGPVSLSRDLASNQPPDNSWWIIGNVSIVGIPCAPIKCVFNEVNKVYHANEISLAENHGN